MTNIEKPNELLIYTPAINNRLTYIFDLILKQELGLNYQFCQDKIHFKNSELYKFTYSDINPFEGGKFIEAQGLLQSLEIKIINIQTFAFYSYKAFFKTQQDSFFPFDIFAASFYLVSRYEEYLPYKADKHGRFQAEESIAFKEGFLDEPIINIWVQYFKKSLLKEYPKLVFKSQRFSSISTIDIDNAWADKNKGFFRTFLSICRLSFTFQFKILSHKIKVLLDFESDKFDNHDYLFNIHEINHLKPIFFILFSDYSKFDKNLSAENTVFQTLLKNIASRFDIGIHPSYNSNKNIKITKNEKVKLEKVIGKPINKSRQHFLMVKLPKTYENLIALNISKDYSMGYSSQAGFRAGLCSSFRFFNLKTNTKTSLEIIPFAIMDACFIHYLKTDQQNALAIIKKIIQSVKEVNGLFVSLWHNENLFELKFENSWRNVFEQMLMEMKDGN